MVDNKENLKNGKPALSWGEKGGEWVWGTQEVGSELGGMEGGESKVRMYCMKENR